MMTEPAVYIHIPYCHRPCYYCAFDRTCSLKSLDAWFDRLCSQIKDELKDRSSLKIPSLYFGGGTPSLLKDEQIETLLSFFSEALEPDAEITLEANPEDLNLERLKNLRSLGINRLSLGVQSFNDGLLEKIGRRHTSNQARGIIEAARQAGFDSISVDLIYGFPFESKDDLENDLNAIVEAAPDHVSAYSWIKEDNSVFGKKDLPEPDEDENADEYELVARRLKEAGYEHYEISSFAKEKKISRHNLNYWRSGYWLAFGYGAAGHDENGFYHHEGSLKDYIDKGYLKAYDHDLDSPFTAVMTGLRSTYGLSLEDFEKQYGLDLEDISGPILEKYKGDLIIEAGCLKPTEKGMEILNEILLDYMDFLDTD